MMADNDAPFRQKPPDPPKVEPQKPEPKKEQKLPEQTQHERIARESGNPTW